MTTDPIATRRYLAEAMKPRTFAAGHADGSVTVDAIEWHTTLSKLNRSERVIRDLEREIRTLTGEGR